MTAPGMPSTLKPQYIVTFQCNGLSFFSFTKCLCIYRVKKCKSAIKASDKKLNLYKQHCPAFDFSSTKTQNLLLVSLRDSRCYRQKYLTNETILMEVKKEQKILWGFIIFPKYKFTLKRLLSCSFPALYCECSHKKKSIIYKVAQ